MLDYSRSKTYHKKRITQKLIKLKIELKFFFTEAVKYSNIFICSLKTTKAKFFTTLRKSYLEGLLHLCYTHTKSISASSHKRIA